MPARLPPPVIQRLRMLRSFVRLLTAAFVLLPIMAAAEPIKLKFSYYTSDREVLYRTVVKPFVDNVNEAGKGLVEIEVFPSGSLGKSYAGQAQLVLDGVADIAFVNPGLTTEQFPDDGVMELSGLFQDVREASFVYSRLLASGALRGYEDFLVIGALAGGPQSIHTRPPVSSLTDLKAKKIRVSNRTEGAVLNALGMFTDIIPINRTAEAISGGSIDGSTGPAVILVDFGIARVVSYHYFIHLGFAPIMIVMNRNKFDSLPKAAQDVIGKFSGEWLAARFAQTFEAEDAQVMEQFKSDPKRTLVFPSEADLKIAQAAFTTISDNWAAASPHNRELLMRVKAEIAKLRAVK